MKLTWQIVKKDARRLKWPLALWLAGLIPATIAFMSEPKLLAEFERPYVVAIDPITASCSVVRAPPSMRIRSMKYRSSSSSGSSVVVR